MLAGRKKIEDNFKCPHNRLSQLVVVVVLERALLCVAGCEESAFPAVQRVADDMGPQPRIDSLLVAAVSCCRCVVLRFISLQSCNHPIIGSHACVELFPPPSGSFKMSIFNLLFISWVFS